MRFSILLLFAALSANAAADFNAEIHRKTLENGLKIIVKEDRRAPVFISKIWYRVGPVDETPGLTGISHMLEHMMFQGTKNIAPGEFSRIIARNGGEDNAFTSRDFTAYYQKMHKSKLALALEMEAERMGNLMLTEAEFSKEREVVLEERRQRIEDRPNAKVIEKLYAISFAEGPYHAPIIGWADDIENYRLVDLQNWYQNYYAPNNAALVVVGDVAADAVFAEAERHFGHYPRNPKLDAKSARPSKPKTGQSAVLKLKAELPFYAISFPVPSLKTTTENAAYQLEMLAYALKNALSEKLLRDAALVSEIDVSYPPYSRTDTLFMIHFTPASGVENAQIVAAIKNEIARLRENPQIAHAEIERIKTQIAAGFIFEQDEIIYQAYYLGVLSMLDLPVSLFDYVEKMREIDAQAISGAAEKYLDFSKMNTVSLLPQKIVR